MTETITGWLTTVWQQSDWTAVGGLSAALTGLVAIFALLTAANDSRDRTRPVIVAELRIPSDPDVKFALVLVVRNVGATTARDLVVKFDPGLVPSGKRAELVKLLKQRYDDPIPSLGPGQELVNSVYINMDRPDESDIPHDMTVSVAYRRSAMGTYRDVYHLRVAVLMAHTTVSVDSPSSVENRLKSIQTSIDSLTRAVVQRG